MKKYFVAVFFSTLAYITVDAQDTVPNVSGKVTVSIKNGTVDCDLTISNMPRLKNYYLRLNSGMNVRYIKNAEETMLPLPYERSMQDTLSSGESLAYYIPAYNVSGKYLPYSIRFNYVGKFPVITDTSSVVDWRGNIAFNGNTLRADGIQSAWCPILYDVEKDRLYEKVTYDLEIICKDCEVIYLNGSKPVSGTYAKVKSNKVQDLTLFAGNIKSVAINNTYFLNPDADFKQLTALEKELQSYRNYMESKLDIPYKGNAVYIQTTPVSKNNSWLFASYPTIVKIGWGEGMKSFVSKTEGPSFMTYMAHELAHYYFGNFRTFNSELGDVISEGFAEYLSLKITSKKISDSLYLVNLQSKANQLGNFNPIPLSKIRSGGDYKNRELYVYYYAPIIFTAIEKEIGDEKMWEWMKELLQSTATFTNYTFFEEALKKVLNGEDRYSLIREKYFNSERSLQNAISRLNLPVVELAPSIQEKQLVKTYYYFFFSRPIIDIGSSQNRMIAHTEVGQLTCTKEELTKMYKPISIKVQEACKNEGGSTADFNTYDSLEQAQAALERWLKRYKKYNNMVVKIVNP